MIEMTQFVIRTDDAAWIERHNGRRSEIDPSAVIVQIPESEIERIELAGKPALRTRLDDCPSDFPNPHAVCPQLLIDKYAG